MLFALLGLVCVNDGYADTRTVKIQVDVAISGLPADTPVKVYIPVAQDASRQTVKRTDLTASIPGEIRPEEVRELFPQLPVDLARRRPALRGSRRAHTRIHDQNHALSMLNHAPRQFPRQLSPATQFENVDMLTVGVAPNAVYLEAGRLRELSYDLFPWRSTPRALLLAPFDLSFPPTDF